MTLRPLENFNLRSSVKFAKVTKLKHSIFQYTGIQINDTVCICDHYNNRQGYRTVEPHYTTCDHQCVDTGYSGPEDHLIPEVGGGYLFNVSTSIHNAHTNTF